MTLPDLLRIAAEEFAGLADAGHEREGVSYRDLANETKLAIERLGPGA